MKRKSLIAGALSLAALYIILCFAGLAGISTPQGGFVCRLVTIAALVYACALAFGTAKDRGGAPLAAALGLSLLAVCEVYTLAYLHLMQGNAADLTVSNYIRPCAYLFFISAVFMLIQLPPKAADALKVGVGTASVAAILPIFYGVVADWPDLLYYSAIAVAAICAVMAIIVIASEAKRSSKPSRRPAVLFAWALLALTAADTANRLMIIFSLGWHWRDAVMSLYPAVYLLVGFALVRLREEAVSNG